MIDNAEYVSLALQTRAGDMRAGEKLAIALHDPLFFFLRLRGIPNRDIEDLAQKTMIEVFRGLPRYDSQRDFLVWFRSVARNVTSKHWRSLSRERQRHEAYRDLLDEQFQDDDMAWPDMEVMRERMHACLEKVAERWQQALHHRYFQGWSSQKIGARLSMKATTVRQGLARSREQLRACLETQPE